MNRQGSIMHWMVFGILAAIGLFMVLTHGLAVSQQKVGPRELASYYDGFITAQLDQIDWENTGKSIFLEAVKEVTAKGGFSTSQTIETTEKNLWNKDGQWTNINLAENIKTLFDTKLHSWLNQDNIEYAARGIKANYKPLTVDKIEFQGTSLIVKSQSKINIDKGLIDAYYAYDSSFVIPAEEFFIFFSKTWEEATKLVDKCSPENSLSDCLKKEMPQNWHYGSCTNTETASNTNSEIQTNQNIPANLRILSFCADWKAYPLQFALDFQPTKPRAIKEAEITAGLNGWELSFPEDDFAESYKPYATDYVDIVDETGTSLEIAAKILLSQYFWNKAELNPQDIIFEESEFCAPDANRLAGKAYSCEGNVIYVLDETLVPAETEHFALAVTTLKNSLESKIEIWAWR